MSEVAESNIQKATRDPPDTPAGCGNSGVKLHNLNKS